MQAVGARVMGEQWVPSDDQQKPLVPAKGFQLSHFFPPLGAILAPVYDSGARRQSAQ